MSSCYTVIMDGQVRRIPDNQAFELANITTAARRSRTHISRRSGRKTACVGHITYVATLEGSSPIGCVGYADSALEIQTQSNDLDVSGRRPKFRTAWRRTPRAISKALR